MKNLVYDHEMRIRQMDESSKRVSKDQEDRISRLTIENKSLKDRLAILELEKPTFPSSNQKNFDEIGKIEYDSRMKEMKEILKQYKE